MAARTEVRRVGVMGGTFDPIHLGHLIAASEALHVFELDRVLFVPTGHPWQKARFSDPEDRFMMTALGASGHQAFAVSRMELDRRGPTYTADTMRQLREFHGEATELFFILGADAVSKLGSWKKLAELRDEVELIAVPRPGFRIDGPGDAGWPRVHVMEMPGVDISATDIRERVRTGRPIAYLVPPAVETYIRDQALYVGTAGEAA